MPVKEKEKQGGTIGRAGETIREIRAELRKVVWPTRQEAINLTGMVMAVSAGVGIFLGVVDTAFSTFFQVLLR